MAAKRDVIIGIVIVVFFLAALGLFGLIFIGFMAEEGGLDLAGLSGNVGVIEVFGTLNEASGRPVVQQLDKWTRSGSIKAIVLHINSPGGGVSISQEIHDAVMRARDEKPVVAAMASVAASGGYYVACAADQIMANPGSLTGSIGVIFQFHTAEELMDKLGIGTETVKSGILKDVGTYSRDMTEQEELMLRSVVMDVYEQFVEAVADGRGIDKDQIYALADGSVFTGHQAYQYGLVDTLGGLTEAVDLAAELAQIEGRPRVVRPYEPRRVTIFDFISGLLGRLLPASDNAWVGPQLLYLYQ